MDATGLARDVCSWVQEQVEDAGLDSTEITPETDLLGSGILDSLGFIELIAHIEELTGTQLDLLDIDPDAFPRVRGLCEFALRSSV